MDTSPPAADRDIKLPPLRGRALLQIAIIVALSAFLLTAKNIRPITLIPLIPVVLWVVLNGLYELLRRDHSFGLSLEGLDDRSLAGLGQVPWNQISDVQVGKLFFTDKLFLGLTEPSQFFRGSLSPVRLWWRLYYRFSGKVPLSSQWAKDAFTAHDTIVDYQDYAFSQDDLSESGFHEANAVAMPSLTLDNRFNASNPAGVIINPFAWILARPFWPLALAELLVVSAMAWLVKSPLSEELGYAPLVANILYWLRVFDHFRRGDCNPGIVLALKPLTIAVATDLTLGQGHYPALKITRYRFSLLAPNEFRVGEIVPTASLYSISFRCYSTRHGNFHPLPLRFATKSEKAIDDAMSTFDEEQIGDLKKMLAALPKHTPGLHHF